MTTKTPEDRGEHVRLSANREETAGEESERGLGGMTRLRLLPWQTPDGKPALLASDREGGYLSRLADRMEAAQVGMAREVLEASGKALTEPKLTEAELRYIATRLRECLQDALRVAESRGGRLPSAAFADAMGEDDDPDPLGRVTSGKGHPS